MLRDLHHQINVVDHITAAVYSATQTPTNGVDLQGARAAEFLIAIGTVANAGSGSWTFKLQESDGQSSGFADVTDPALVLTEAAQAPVGAPDGTTGVFLTVDEAAEDDAVYRVGYLGAKRYVRVVATAENTPGNTPLAVLAVLEMNLRPASDG